MKTRVYLLTLPCVRSVLWTKDLNTPSKLRIFAGLEAERALLEAATETFVLFWSKGRAEFLILPRSGQTYVDMSIDAGEISLRVVGTETLQLAVVVPPRGTDPAIETSRKSLVRSLRNAFRDELEGRSGITASKDGAR